MKSLLVIPSKDECYSLYGLCREASKYVDQIIVVEDGSENHYEDVVRYAHIMRFTRNHGKGYVVRHALERYWSAANVYVFMDGDGQHDPKDIPALLESVKTHDLVVGYRRDLTTTGINKVGNFFLNMLLRLFTNLRLRDSQSGFRAITRDAWERMKLKGNRYEFETEVLLEADRLGLKVGEAPIRIMKYKKGVNALDGLRIGFFVLRRKLFK